MRTSDKAQEQLETILSKFETGKLPKALAVTSLPQVNVPCRKWSMNNRLLVFWAGTQDARGIRQWRELGRHPKKGCRALYILTPMHIKKVERNEDTCEERERQILTGFRCVPVFKMEDTKGKPFEYPDFDPPSPPPLYDVAKSWGLEVKYLPGNEFYFGYYSPSAKRIGLCTHDEQTFFHELAHAAHEKVRGQLRARQNWQEEIVAELTAATLAHLHGKKPNDGDSYRYIRDQAKKAGKDVYGACMAVVSDTGKCLELILQKAEKLEAVVSDAKAAD